VTDALAVKLHNDIFKLNGFKVAPRKEDETNVYLVKSLPLIKKTTFSINGNSLTPYKML
jgi:hypothetical protein